MSEIISPPAGMQLVLNDDEYIYDQTILHSGGLSDVSEIFSIFDL